MIKEKIIFWSLLAVFIGVSVFGFLSQGKKKEATEGLLRDIETATKKTMAQKDAFLKDKWDLGQIRSEDALDNYSLLLKRSPFFRIRSEVKTEKLEPARVAKKTKKATFKYKGKVMMGTKVMVIIEDRGTGKSFFVQEGDVVGDYVVLRIEDKQVALKQKDGKEIILKAAKKESGREEETGEVKEDSEIEIER